MSEPESLETNSFEPVKTVCAEKRSTQLLTESWGRGTEEENLSALAGEDEEWEVLSPDGDGGGINYGGEVELGGGESGGGLEMGDGRGGEGLKGGGEMELEGGGGVEIGGGVGGCDDGGEVKLGGSEGVEIGGGVGGSDDSGEVKLGGGGGVEISGDVGGERLSDGEGEVELGGSGEGVEISGGEVEMGGGGGGEGLENGGVELATEAEEVQPLIVEIVEERESTTEHVEVRDPLQSGDVMDCEGNELKNGTVNRDGEDKEHEKEGKRDSMVKNAVCEEGVGSKRASEKENTGPR